MSLGEREITVDLSSLTRRNQTIHKKTAVKALQATGTVFRSVS